MSGYVTVNRLSRVQLYSEERKQQAHLRKIAEMQRRSGLDNSHPTHFPHIHSFTTQVKEKNKEIMKENDAKSKRILNIMQSKTAYTLPSSHPTSPHRRQQTLNLSQNNTDYMKRIAKAKGTYNVREWNRGFEEHKEHLKISKDNKLFTPRDIAIHRQRMRTTSVPNSKGTTPTLLTLHMGHQSDNND